MSMVSSFSSKDDKTVVARIRSALAATILHDFLVRTASKKMEEGKFFEAEVALHDANELTVAMEEAFEEESNG